jgi:hypothetical protein
MSVWISHMCIVEVKIFVEIMVLLLFTCNPDLIQRQHLFKIRLATHLSLILYSSDM